MMNLHVVAGALIVCLAGTDACSNSTPYSAVAEFHNGGDQPIAASPSDVWTFAQRALRERGGLPPDAILANISGERAIAVDATSPVAGHQMSYIYEWRPPVIGSNDRVMLMIASSETTSCKNCRAYDVRYGLYVQMFTRKWTPAAVRERQQMALRKSLAPAPPPYYVSSSCKGKTVNIPALRRATVALGEHADSLGVYRPVEERSLLKIPNWVYARFSPFTIRRKDPDLHKWEAIDILGVVIADYPATGPRYVEILSREKWSFARLQDVWLQFIDTDNEAVCAHSPPAQPISPSLLDKGLSPEAIRYDALDRSSAEAMWTRNSFKNSAPEIVSTSQSTDGTVLVTSIQQGDGTTWHGSFFYNANGVLTRASFAEL
jgi:hypothetical protein